MFAAPRIKPRPAPRTTRRAPHILPNRQLHLASPAKYRRAIPLASRPNLDRMSRQLDMTILASPIFPAAAHLDRNNIRRAVIMPATSLRIEPHAAHLW